jgi:hypothetical protein
MGAYAHSITAYAVISKWPQGDAKKFIVRQSAAHLADALRRVPIEGSYCGAPLKQPRSIASQGASVESRTGAVTWAMRQRPRFPSPGRRRRSPCRALNRPVDRCRRERRQIEMEQRYLQFLQQTLGGSCRGGYARRLAHRKQSSLDRPSPG